MLWFVLGIVVGFFVSFFLLKRQIQKDGAGQLKVCQSCPFYNTRSSDTGVEHEWVRGVAVDSQPAWPDLHFVALCTWCRSCRRCLFPSLSCFILLYVEGGSKTDTTVTAFTVTSELVQPLVDTINSGLNVLVPIGIGIMGTFIGIRLVRRIIYTFL